MRSLKGLALCTLLVAVSTGTAACSLVNPYSSKFKCPDGEDGKCQPIRESYEDSLAGLPPDPAASVPDSDEELAPGPGSCPGCAGGRLAPAGMATISAQPASYDEMVLERLTELVSEPRAPMVMPAQAMRILVLPYRGREGHLYMERYIYVITEEPRWLLQSPP